MTQETALGTALKSAVQSMSKKKQTQMITDHIYHKYDVFKRCKPLALGIDKELIADLPQFDPSLISRVLTNHCHRPRYLIALSRGGKRFNLRGKPQGEITPEEQAIATQNPVVQESLARRAAADNQATENESVADNSASQ